MLVFECLVLLCGAAITSVVGAAYTSVSFIRSFSPVIEKYHNWVIILFILLSTVTFVLVGRPVNILLLVGALNALILPIALGTLLIAVFKKSIVGTYKHPLWLTISGGFVVLVMGYLGIMTLIEQIPLLFK